jgi:hypothetical protein
MEALDVSNAAAATAAPKEVKLGEKEYTVSRLRMGAIGLIQEQINKLPRPDLIPQLRKDLEGLPPETLQALMLPAIIRMTNWPPDLLMNPDAVVEIARNPPIMKRLVYLAIKRNHPDITQPEADDLFDDLDPRDMDELMKVALDLKVAEKKVEAGENGDSTTRPDTDTSPSGTDGRTPTSTTSNSPGSSTP